MGVRDVVVGGVEEAAVVAVDRGEGACVYVVFVFEREKMSFFLFFPF